MKPKLIRLVTIPAARGSQKGIVKTRKIIAAISNICVLAILSFRSARVICNTLRWNLIREKEVTFLPGNCTASINRASFHKMTRYLQLLKKLIMVQLIASVRAISKETNKSRPAFENAKYNRRP